MGVSMDAGTKERLTKHQPAQEGRFSEPVGAAPQGVAADGGPERRHSAVVHPADQAGRPPGRHAGQRGRGPPGRRDGYVSMTRPPARAGGKLFASQLRHSSRLLRSNGKIAQL